MNIAMKATTTEPTAMVMTSSMSVKPRAAELRVRMSIIRAVPGQGHAAARCVAHRDIDAAGRGRRHTGERARLGRADVDRIAVQGGNGVAELIMSAHVHQAVVLIDEVPAGTAG